MSTPETEISQWRTAILRNRAVDEGDADELESHLREQIAELEEAGLSGDEAFIIAVKRLGQVDRVTAEFARVHGDRLWKQLAVSTDAPPARRTWLLMLVCALIAGALLQTAKLVAQADPSAGWFTRDLGLFVLPVLAAYFVLERRMGWRQILAPAIATIALAAVVNLYPFVVTPTGTQFLGTDGQSDTATLVAIHLPIALWLIVGVAYLAGDVRSRERRMDFIRFSGEWAIYYALIALGGGVLMALTAAILGPIAPDVLGVIVDWVLPFGIAGAVIVAAWLVEAKKSIIENLAPVLTMIFTPLFAAMLLGSVVVYAIAGRTAAFDRDLLTVFDILLLVVLGLVVYGISARRSVAAGAMDVIRLIAVVAAVLLDLLVLGAMLSRIGELGVTPNRVAAIGLNLILLVNLVGTAWLTVRMLAGRSPVARLENWQTGYLPVFAGWVAIVVVVLPPVFAFA